MKPNKKLTDYEVAALKGEFNLADGHARYRLRQSYSKIIDIMTQSNPMIIEQKNLEYEFSTELFQLANQGIISWINRSLFCPSASISIEIVANYLRLQALSVSLIEPVFDNLADILKRHKILSAAIKEDKLTESEITKYLDNMNTDAYFFVLPNNPTGYIVNQSEFEKVVEHCKAQNKLLILDFSFRFFSREFNKWSQYSILEDSGVKFIAIEDTGKTWPTFELKASSIVADKVTFLNLQKIYRDFFINLSPIILHLLTQFIKETNLNSLDNILSLIDNNRKNLHSLIQGSVLVPIGLPNGSVEWLKINEKYADIDIIDHSRAQGLHLLPGRHFFWEEKTINSNYMRIALMRDSDYFLGALERLELTMKRFI